jgi:hypothetical protein
MRSASDDDDLMSTIVTASAFLRTLVIVSPSDLLTASTVGGSSVAIAAHIAAIATTRMGTLGVVMMIYKLMLAQ